ncbi:hypothetical protein CLAFUW4_11752 [Fulvia fulva]|uniref:Heterokaryon incompatibility domain-containing protein n=1 Tax=Passalora fulva TaxID=5499 RepID=A0A9Q8PE73_PASFU|nr:uncharacterized protein CLAFUR5_10796 [Fulvia fulva]KAK4617757.1 hypothetical protein CLAFUR4_11757 [Fulvia fulva]KAK4618757.1 hypothetical protein CLAFUR0_11770 [Fulvia fulva]UJO20833.1 hypothetical protein CLAFUR5_10796 [Fulvia fulva]WPV17984.1 hypothetical protein CLAFUW4_11752 [Fulvia fulva]WPV32855.1 hypothetical protein CLAFUW7_11759 [Fulvia fulva]
MESRPNNTVVHTSLDDAEKQTRLLRLEPGTGSDVIELSVERYQLTEAPEYFAISYTWGKESIPAHVSVNGSRWPVRWNCWYALSQVRYHYPGCRLWIGSICINQSDLAEKSHQVAMRFEIYGTAAKVLACVGPHANGSEMLASTTMDPDSTCSVIPYSDTHGEAWRSFARRRYWRRLWIVQEIVAAARRNEENVQVLCGHMLLPWRLVVAGASRAVTLDEEQDYPDPKKQTIRQITLVCANPIELADAVKRFDGFECSNILDLRPDYNKSPWDLALEMCSWLPLSSLPPLIHTLGLEDSYNEMQAVLNARSERNTTEAESPHPEPHLRLARPLWNSSEKPRFFGSVHVDSSGCLVIPNLAARNARIQPLYPDHLKSIIGLEDVPITAARERVPPQPLFSGRYPRVAMRRH